MRVITSYSIHYTKLYDGLLRNTPLAAERTGFIANAIVRELIPIVSALVLIGLV